jgi:hypothetical protein
VADPLHAAADPAGRAIRALAGCLRGITCPVGDAASRVASGLESSGKYLQDEGLSGMAKDLGDLVKRNPIPAMLVGIGIGFLLARATSSRS